MKKTLVFAVFGSSSFIGSHLVDVLLKSGYEVHGFSRKKIQTNVSNLKFQWHKFDISKNLSLKSLPPNAIIFDCISETTPANSCINTPIIMGAEIRNHVRLISDIISTKPRKYLYLSTGGGIYGFNVNHSLHKETDMPQPISPHAIIKMTLENYINYHCKMNNIEYVICRISNPYGPGQASKEGFGLIPTIIENIKNNKSPVLFGNGKLKRDYIHIDDLINMLKILSENSCKFNLYNLGSGKLTSNFEVFQKISKILNPEIKPNLAKKRFFDAEKSGLDISRFQSEFSYELKAQHLCLNFIKI